MGLRLRRQASSAAIARGSASARARAFRCCAARCRRRWAAPKMWRGRSRSSSRSAACTRSRSASTSSSRRSCSRCRTKASTIVDGQQLMSDARVIKTQDEISLLNHVGDDGGRGLRRAVSRDEAGHARERGRRAGEQGALRSGLGIRRRRERDFRRALQSASARFFRSRAAPRRSRLLRHSAFLHGLSHLLLPLLHDRLRFARA